MDTTSDDKMIAAMQLTINRLTAERDAAYAKGFQDAIERASGRMQVIRDRNGLDHISMGYVEAEIRSLKPE